MEKIKYIYGIEDKGRSVIRTLEAFGGKNEENFIGDQSGCMYYIGPNNCIQKCHCETIEEIVVRVCGEELTVLSDLPVLSFDDLDHTYGYQTIGNHRTIHLQNGKTTDCFATEQNAISSEAASMISQVREQCTNQYGKVNDGCQFAIIRTVSNNIEIFDLGKLKYVYMIGGLLRFNTREQAELFLENNKELVEEYLKTF